jgi:hypothetical protein
VSEYHLQSITKYPTDPSTIWVGSWVMHFEVTKYVDLCGCIVHKNLPEIF